MFWAYVRDVTPVRLDRDTQNRMERVPYRRVLANALSVALLTAPKRSEVLA